MLLVVCFFFLFYQRLTHARCRKAGDAGGDNFFPSLEINVLEFKEEDVLPTGNKATIICRSNCSTNAACPKHLQPYRIILSFNGTLKKSCGGGYLQSHYERSKTCFYPIHNTTEGNSGDYACRTYNRYGCTLDTLRLVFKEPSPPRFLVKNPHQLSVPNGGNTTLTCTATGIPLPVITWYKNGHPVLRSSVTGFKGYSLLRLHDAGLGDQGEYWCEANSKEGWDRTSLTTLNVLWKPVFFTHPQRHTAHLNRDGFVAVTLSCEAKGFPSPVISWLQNNSSLTLDATITQNGSTTSLAVVFKKETEQPLKYCCLAKNSMGETLSKKGEITIIATSRRNIPVSDDKSSSSLSVSKAVRISIPVGIVFVIINSILLFVFYKKFNRPTAASNQMNYIQRFPNLHMHARAMSTPSEDHTTPRYKMTETV